MQNKTISKDEFYMAVALSLARRAACEGEVPVGALVVKDGRILGTGHNRCESRNTALAHAEMEALLGAARATGGWRLTGCTLYVTMEPCPMCAGAIMNSRVSRVVYAARDSRAGAAGTCVNVFSMNYGPAPIVTAGVLEKESRDLLAAFFTARRRENEKRRPVAHSMAAPAPSAPEPKYIKRDKTAQRRNIMYTDLHKDAQALLNPDDWYITNLSNAAALLWERLPGLNWAGFYLMRDGELQLGPFQGKTACTHIAVGKGVCGTAVAQNATQLVPNVHEFPGHIACDSASNSEIVVPLRRGGAVVGVLDIDSPHLGRFTQDDKVGLEAFAALLEENWGAK